MVAERLVNSQRRCTKGDCRPRATASTLRTSSSVSKRIRFASRSAAEGTAGAESSAGAACELSSSVVIFDGSVLPKQEGELRGLEVLSMSSSSPPSARQSFSRILRMLMIVYMDRPGTRARKEGESTEWKAHHAFVGCADASFALYHCLRARSVGKSAQ